MCSILLGGHLEILDDVNEIPPTVILVAKLYENIALQCEKEPRRNGD